MMMMTVMMMMIGYSPLIIHFIKSMNYQTPCGHNFCLKCFEKWIGQGKKTCAKCRESIPAMMAKQPRINASLVYAIRAARTRKPAAAVGPRVFQYVSNDDLPDECFTTERAVKSGKANAKSGKIFVTIPPDYLGPITAEYDPVRNSGVLVGILGQIVWLVDSWVLTLLLQLAKKGEGRLRKRKMMEMIHHPVLFMSTQTMRLCNTHSSEVLQLFRMF